jgi:two-component system, NarL family, sensor histidine kinase BarA
MTSPGNSRRNSRDTLFDVSSTSALDRPIPLADLLDSAALDEVVKSYADFHGVGITVVDATGRGLGQAGGGEAICAAIRARPAGLTRCEAKLGEVRGLRPMIDAPPARCDCFNGLRYQVVPLAHQGTLLGTLVVGPYLPDDRPATVTGMVQQIMDDAGAAAEALARLTPMPDAQARRIAEHVARVLDLLILASWNRHVTAQVHLATLAETYEQLADKNARLAAAVERMQEVDRLKSNFLATVSHELRTPLTSVIGYSEMLLEGLAGSLNEEQREYVQTIMEKGDQLLQLITGILDVSKIEAGTLRIARDPVDLDELIGGAIAAMTPLARRKKLEVRFVVTGSGPRALGDRDKIRQILLNLVNNAVKFTPDGGKVEIQVTVGALAREEDVGPFALGSTTPADLAHLGLRMRVVDSGIGIAPEKQARIFEPFFQVDSSSTREYGGTGLGLTLVKSYVEAHGGKVWVDSELGRGSCFTITLPAVEAELAAYVVNLANSSSSADRTQP